MEFNHDQAFLHILRERKNINNFLDAFFGFLYRCTDFYVESNPEQRLGFPPGVTEELVLNSMYKWKKMASTLPKTTTPTNNIAINNNNTSQSIPLMSENLESKNCDLVPSVAHEVEIDSCEKLDNVEPFFTRLSETDHTSDSYNGAIRENYVWTQTLSDIDVLVKIPEHIKRIKNAVRVDISSDEIKIDVKSPDCTKNSEWDNIFNGKLSFKIRKDESIWSIVSGKHISIHLEKASQRWWEALTIDEPKLDLSKIDCTKHFDDMAPEEQMKVQELIWNHQQKLLGKPTSEQIKMATTLKQAWNAKGSPFQGTPYDPSILKYN